MHARARGCIDAEAFPFVHRCSVCQRDGGRDMRLRFVFCCCRAFSRTHDRFSVPIVFPCSCVFVVIRNTFLQIKSITSCFKSKSFFLSWVCRFFAVRFHRTSRGSQKLRRRPQRGSQQEASGARVLQNQNRLTRTFHCSCVALLMLKVTLERKWFLKIGKQL